MDEIISLSKKPGVSLNTWIMEQPFVPTIRTCLHENAFEYVMAYHSKEHYRKIDMESIIIKTPKWYQIRGSLLNFNDLSKIVPVIIEASEFQNLISYKLQIYRQLRKAKCPLPWFSSSFRLWNQPILVREPLEMIQMGDDPCQIGKDILKQLWYIHAIGTYTVIYQSDIGKRVNNNFGNEIQYFLTNYGNISLKGSGRYPLGSGVRSNLLDLGNILMSLATTHEQTKRIRNYIMYIEDDKHIGSYQTYSHLSNILDGISYHHSICSLI